MLKNRNDAYGINCINFELCPICYGCRNMDERDKDCLICKRKHPDNVCNRKKHKDYVIGKAVTKQSVEVSNESI